MFLLVSMRLIVEDRGIFRSQFTSSFTYFAAGDICILPMIEGPCKGFMPQWFYNSKKGRCEQFIYGGCSGNANRFSTKAKCQLRCVGKWSDKPYNECQCCQRFTIQKSPPKRFLHVLFFLVDPAANTACLRQQFLARRNKRLGVFVPRCLPDGRYDKVQCHGSVCFCMDEEGEEVPGTRVYRNQDLDCKGKFSLPTGNHSRFIYQSWVVCYLLHYPTER